MSFFSKLVRYFDSHVETSDHHVDERLQTHYYKATKDKAMKAVEEIINNDPSLSLIEVSKERGEVAANIVKGKKGLLVITIINVGPYKISVDVACSSDKGFLGGFGIRQVLQFYSGLNSQFATITL